MMTWLGPKVWFALAVLGISAVAACDKAEAPRLEGSDGAPTTGASGPVAPAPDAPALHRAAVQALVEKAGVSVDLASVARAPLVGLEVTLDEASRSFTAVATIDLVQPGDAGRTSLDFVLPANVGTEPRVTLDRVEVDGRLVDPRGDRARWTLPVTIAPGAAARVVVRMAGKLDGKAAALPQPSTPTAVLEVLPPGFMPFVASAEPERAFGEKGGVTVLWGIVPRLVEAGGVGRMSVDATLTAPSDLVVAASGVEVGRERKGAATAFHWVAVDVPEVAIVTARGLAASQAKAGGVALSSLAPADAAGVAGDVLTIARRTLETLETGWGRAPVPELRVIACPMLDGAGVVALPGLVLVPAGLFHGEAPALKDDLAAALLAHHPAPKEALDLAVATAVAAQWWLGRGADAATALVLEQGLARAGALRALEQADGDKAARRALALGLQLPYQTARADQGAEPVLSRASASGEVGTRGFASPGEGMAAAAKAGLFGEALSRHLGAELFDAALRALPPGPVALPALRTAWLAQAPRRAETEALLARWLDEAHADEDVGPIRPEVLLEYLVSDGAVDGTVRTLMDELGKRPDLIGKGLGGALGDGLTPGLALDLLDQLTGPKDPTLQKWLDAAKGVLGQNREAELQKLVDEIGSELGLPEAERARLRQMGGLVMKALGEDGPAPRAPGDAPPSDPDAAP